MEQVLSDIVKPKMIMMIEILMNYKEVSFERIYRGSYGCKI